MEWHLSHSFGARNRDNEFPVLGRKLKVVRSQRMHRVLIAFFGALNTDPGELLNQGRRLVLIWVMDYSGGGGGVIMNAMSLPESEMSVIQPLSPAQDGRRMHHAG